MQNSLNFICLSDSNFCLVSLVSSGSYKDDWLVVMYEIASENVAITEKDRLKPYF